MGFFDFLKNILKPTKRYNIDIKPYITENIQYATTDNYILSGIDMIAKEVAKAKIKVWMLEPTHLPSDILYQTIFYYYYTGKVALCFLSYNPLEVKVVFDFDTKDDLLVSKDIQTSEFIVFYNPVGSVYELLKPYTILQQRLLQRMMVQYDMGGISGVKAPSTNIQELEDVYELLAIIKRKIQQGNLFVVPSDIEIVGTDVNIENAIQLENTIRNAIFTTLGIPQVLFSEKGGSYALAKEQLKAFYYTKVSSLIEMVVSELEKHFEKFELFEKVEVDVSGYWYLDETYQWQVSEVVNLYQAGIIDRDEARKMLKINEEIAPVEGLIDAPESETEPEDEVVEQNTTQDIARKIAIKYNQLMLPLEKKLIKKVKDFIVKNLQKTEFSEDGIVNFVLEIFNVNGLWNTFKTYFENINNIKDAVRIDVKKEFLQKSIEKRISYITEALQLQSSNLIEKINKEYQRLLESGQEINKDVLKKEFLKQWKETYKNQVKTIIRTELNRLYNDMEQQGIDEIKDKIKLKKKWITANDEKVRDNHRKLGNLPSIPVDEVWVVNNITFKRPHSEGLPASEVVNCRCSIAYELEEE